MVCSAASISTNPLSKTLKLYVFLMCEFKEAELYCVRTKMRLRHEFKQLDIGISTNLYFPAMGTAGLERIKVKGFNLVPFPPPKTMDITLGCITFLLVFFEYLTLLDQPNFRPKVSKPLPVLSEESPYFSDENPS